MHRCSIFANFLLSLKTNINLGWWQVLRLAVDTLTWNAGFSFWVGSSIGRSVLVSWLPPQSRVSPTPCQLASSVLDQARGCFKIKISEQGLCSYEKVRGLGKTSANALLCVAFYDKVCTLYSQALLCIFFCDLVWCMSALLRHKN